MTETTKSERDQLLDDVIAHYQPPKEGGTANHAGYRNLLADHYEDGGAYDAAECQRWLSRNGKRPYTGVTEPRGVAVWFHGDKVSQIKAGDQQGLGDTESDLPTALYEALKSDATVANHRLFRVKVEPPEGASDEDKKELFAKADLVASRMAEAAILEAWLSLTPEQRAFS